MKWNMFFASVAITLAPTVVFAQISDAEQMGGDGTRSQCSEFWFHGSPSRNNENGMSIITARCPQHTPRYIGHSWYGSFTHDNGYCNEWPTPKATTERETALYRYNNGGQEQNGIYIRRNLLARETREMCEDQYGHSSAPDWWQVNVRLMCCPN